jgi:hypothetical protein
MKTKTIVELQDSDSSFQNIAILRFVEHKVHTLKLAELQSYTVGKVGNEQRKCFQIPLVQYQSNTRCVVETFDRASRVKNVDILLFIEPQETFS